MYHMAYHQEALRRQRVIERKRLALARLKEQYTRQNLGKKQKSKENQTEKDESTGTRAGTRKDKCEETRADTNEIHSRDTLRLPHICQTTTGGTYHQLIPAKGKPLHQWRDLKNRIRHDYNLVPLPYRKEHVVNR